MSWRRVAAAWAGPLSIAGLVLWRSARLLDRTPSDERAPGPARVLAPPLVVPRALARRRRRSRSGTPTRCSGYRFAADPQSGWLYLPPMALFTALSPGVAMRAMVILAQPLLAGLGLYAFLRVDGVGRVGATAGGPRDRRRDGASEVAIAMPFAGALAWTSMALLAAAGFLRAERWSRRLWWLALGGLRVVAAGERAPVARPRDGHRGARGRTSWRGPTAAAWGRTAAVPGGAPRARDAGARRRGSSSCPCRASSEGYAALAGAGESGGREDAPSPSAGLGRLAPRLRRCPGRVPRRA